MKYNNPVDFENDLLEWLKQHARSTEELKDLKQQIVTDRILARFDTKDLILEGGAATKYHASPTAHTKDIDAVITKEVIKQHGLDKMYLEERAEFLQHWVDDRLRQSAGDFLKLRCDQASPITNMREGEPCVRAWVSADLNRHEFVPLFELDLALQDKPIPTVTMPGRDLLNFAEIEKAQIQLMCPEYLIADKLTLFLKENADPKFERPNDIAHIVALIERCDLNQDRLAEGLAAFAVQRDVVNELKERIPDPPYDRLENRFQEAIIDQSKMDISMPEAMQRIRDAIDPVRDKAFELAIEKLTNREIEPQEKDRIEQESYWKKDTDKELLSKYPASPGRDAGLQFLLGAQSERSHRVEADRQRAIEQDLNKSNADRTNAIDDRGDPCLCGPEEYAVVVPVNVGLKLIEMERIEPETMIYLQEKFSELQEPRILEHVQDQLQRNEPLQDLQAAINHARQDMIPVRESSQPHREVVIAEQKERLGAEYEISYLTPKEHDFMVVSYRCEPANGYYAYWSSVQVGWDRVTDRITTDHVVRDMPEGAHIIEHRTGDVIDKQQDFDLDR